MTILVTFSRSRFTMLFNSKLACVCCSSYFSSNSFCACSVSPRCDLAMIRSSVPRRLFVIFSYVFRSSVVSGSVVLN